MEDDVRFRQTVSVVALGQLVIRSKVGEGWGSVLKYRLAEIQWLLLSFLGRLGIGIRRDWVGKDLKGVQKGHSRGGDRRMATIAWQSAEATR